MFIGIQYAAMGVSLASALEIFSQPDDLHFQAAQIGEKWAFAISRGPGHNYKLLLSTEPVFDTIEATVRMVGKVLGNICTAVTSELNDPSSFAAQMLNGEGIPLDDAHALSGAYRERIIRDLLENHVADTSTYKGLPDQAGE